MGNWWRPCLAELIGTFALIFIGAGSICANQYLISHQQEGIGVLGIAIAHGLVVAVMVSSIGHISGGHINPAVTLGVMLAGKIEANLGFLYMASQVVGGMIAAFLLLGVFSPEVRNAVNLGTPGLSPDVSFGVGTLLEAILTFLLVFTVFATAIDDKGAFKSIAGFGIGLVVAFDILMGGPLTGASMNPARTFGPAVASGYWSNHLVYWIGPMIGGAGAGLVYGGIFLKKR